MLQSKEDLQDRIEEQKRQFSTTELSPYEEGDQPAENYESVESGDSEADSVSETHGEEMSDTTDPGEYHEPETNESGEYHEADTGDSDEDSYEAASF